VHVVGRGLNRWSNVHVDDVAALYRLALEKAPAGSFYFVENGEASWLEIGEALAARIGMGTGGLVEHRGGRGDPRRGARPLLVRIQQPRAGGARPRRSGLGAEARIGHPLDPGGDGAPGMTPAAPRTPWGISSSSRFPFFALVLCGYLATSRHMVPMEAIPGLNTFVLFFALPCMLYRFASSTPIVRLLDPSVCLTYLLCAARDGIGACGGTTRGRPHSDWKRCRLRRARRSLPELGVPWACRCSWRCFGPHAAGIRPSLSAGGGHWCSRRSLCIALCFARLDAGRRSRRRPRAVQAGP
jgi:hypothetical protein